MMNKLKAAIAVSPLLVGCATVESSTSIISEKELECFVVYGADIAPSTRRYEPTEEMSAQEQYAIANQGHVITEGSATVVAIREFNDRNGAIDAQSFKKLTMKLVEPPKMDGPIAVSESHFISGSSAFVAWGLYYVSIDGVRKVEVADEESRMRLIVRQDLPLFRVPDGVKDNIKVEFECELSSKSVDELSAWEGNPAAKNDPFYP